MPSDAFDPRFEIKVEPQSVTLLVHGSSPGNQPVPGRSDVERMLHLHKVQHGVNWQAVDRVLNERLFDTPHIIVSGIPAKDGRNAYIEEKVKVDSSVEPQILVNGNVDFKNIDNIHCVEEGQVLAIKHPAEPGEPGQDIFGNPIPVKAVQDIQFRVGANTSLSGDGQSLLAVTAGFVYRHGGTICVGRTYVVKGDVGFKTGNIRYSGEVVVLGNVTDGFAVEAEGDIVVEGTVESATLVSRNGNVRIKQGIFGHGKGRIAARLSLHILSAQDAFFECGEAFEVDRELRNCHVVAGRFKADKPGCCVICGSVKSYSDVLIAVLGGEGCRTDIRILDKIAEAAEIRLSGLDAEVNQKKADLEALEKKLGHMTTMLQRMGARMSARARMEMKDARTRQGNWTRALSEFHAERARLLEDMNSTLRHMGKCGVTEKVVRGCFLNLYGDMLEMTEGEGGKEWCWTPKGLVCRSMASSRSPA